MKVLVGAWQDLVSKIPQLPKAGTLSACKTSVVHWRGLRNYLPLRLFGVALGEMATRGHFCPIFLRGVVSIHLHLAGHYLMFAGLGGFHGRRKYLNSPII